MANQRLNYFSGQFLHEVDFETEQAYHLNSLRSHNRLLHTWGIAQGLELSWNVGGSKVFISPGSAMDRSGRLFELKTPIEPIDFVLTPANYTECYLVISFIEMPTDPSLVGPVSDFTRVTEDTMIEILPALTADMSMKIILGKINLSRTDGGGCIIQSIDVSLRHYSGYYTSGLLAEQLTIRLDNPDDKTWPNISGSESSVQDTLGNLLVNASLTELSGNLVVKGDLTVQGPSTSITSQNLVVSDQIIQVNKYAPQAKPANLDGGLEVFRGGTAPEAQIIWDEATDRWMIGVKDGLFQIPYGSLTVSPQGYVGINNNNPAVELDIIGRVSALIPNKSSNVSGDINSYGVTVTNGKDSALTIRSLGSGAMHMATDKKNRQIRLGGGLFEETLIIAPGGFVGIGTVTPNYPLEVMGNVKVDTLIWANGSSVLNSDQGGSAVLGDSLMAGATPYVDFHFGMGATQDYNMRLINDADGQLTISSGRLQVISQIQITSTTGNESLKIGHDTAQNVSFTNNRITAYNEGVPSVLHLNTQDAVNAPVQMGTLNVDQSAAIQGSLGIGTNNTMTTLDVRGNVQVVMPDAAGNISGDIASYGFSVGNSLDSTLAIRSLGKGVMHMATDLLGRQLRLGGGLFEETLTIASGGKIGIMTTSPKAVLHIGGVAGTDGIMFPDGTLQKTAGEPRLWEVSGKDIYYTTGKVGIGTNPPLAALDVQGLGRFLIPDTTSNISGDPGSYGIEILNGKDTGLSIRSMGGGAMHLATDTVAGQLRFGGGLFEESLFINAGGNIGIGVKSPAQKLEIAGAVQAINFIGDGSQLTGIPLKWNYSARPGSIYYNDGNVGIGADIPASLLTVAHKAGNGPQNGLSPIGNYNLLLRGGDTNAGAMVGIALHPGTDDEPITNVFSAITGKRIDNLNGEIGFVTQGGGTISQRMVINSFGNVGIGTTNPKTKLDVNGTIKTTTLALSGGVEVNYISNDFALTMASPNALVTEAAVKGYMNQSGVGIPLGYLLAGPANQPAPTGFLGTHTFTKVYIKPKSTGIIESNNQVYFYLSEIISVGSLYYLIGGYEIINNGWYPSKRTFSYNPVDGTVKEVAPMINGRYYHFLVEIGGYIYAVGGYVYRQDTTQGWFNSVERYDPSTDHWTEVAGWNTNHGNSNQYAVQALGGYLYVIHGYGIRADGTWGALQVMEKFDPASGRWTYTSPRPVENQYLYYNNNSLSYNGKLYLFGGYRMDAATGVWSVRKDVFCYDPVADAWNALAPMATARYSEMAVFGDQRKLYVYGGYSVVGWNFDLEVYDIATNTWQVHSNLTNSQPIYSQSYYQKNKVVIDGILVLGYYQYGNAFNVGFYSTIKQKYFILPFDMVNGWNSRFSVNGNSLSWFNCPNSYYLDVYNFDSQSLFDFASVGNEIEFFKRV